MAWPPTPSSNFIVNGSTSTTLYWGTDSIYGSAIVKSARQSTMVEEVRIENGTGLTAIQILLIDGQEYEFTCVYDTATVTASSLAVGSPVTLRNLPGTSGDQNFIVTAFAVNAARKQEAELVVSAKYFSTAGVP